MKRFFPYATALVLLLCLCVEVRAHRVNVFAFVEGDHIRVECAFSKSRKVKSGRIIVRDAATGIQILEGATDTDGNFSFRPPQEVLRAGHDLSISVEAGEGHRNAWTVSASELQALGPSLAAPAAPDERPTVPDEAPHDTTPATPARVGQAPNTLPGPAPDAQAYPGLNAQELEALLGKMLDARLAPINRTLAQLQERGPELRDIIGGIGWILGLLGLAAYCRTRRA